MSNQEALAPRPRLAIIGGGSSGLISLKYALDHLPTWEIACFEQSDQYVGCWGRPYPGFVSTSTRYTTQFACFPVTDAQVNATGAKTFEEFFREDEYGQYLAKFVEHFGLASHIRLNTRVHHMQRLPSGQWQLTISHGTQSTSIEPPFDAVIVCTGLAARPKETAGPLPRLSVAELHSRAGLDHVRQRRIVVLGGGESAVDYAVRLSRPHLQNKVYLSLASGIRVSPRYHPIRGVPSDFLRNRLMLSIHPDLRNWIGQRFVEARIRYQEQFERWFPARRSAQANPESPPSADDNLIERQKYWAYLLTARAKDQLFNMFHNKSDGFLEAVARGEIEIVGLPNDESYERCQSFDSEDMVEVHADLLVPAIGYRSTLDRLSEPALSVREFYLGCMHATYDNLFLVGFARPIIGNIPTISEMQARYVTGLMAGRWPRPVNMAARHQQEAARLARQFAKLNLDAIYPVEMFPYCDHLARLMSAYPTARAARSWWNWCRMQLTPATTMHYFLEDEQQRHALVRTPVYMPVLLITLLLVLKPVDWMYRWGRGGEEAE